MMADATLAAPRGAKDSALPFPARLALAVCVLWVLAGLIGHEPWRPQEPDLFGVAFEMLQTGDWVVPTLAGEPFLRDPPLPALSAALFARVLDPVLALHDGARLATGMWMALALVCLGAAARELTGAGKSWLAPLALVGCVGLILPAHFMLADIPHLAGIALAILGWALGLRRAWRGGLALGTGLGIAFLSRGLFFPACVALTAVLLPLVSARWRTRRYAVVLAVAAAAALPWLAIWPVLLYHRSPALFHQWLWVENLARLGPIWPLDRPGYFLAILPWFAFPVLPLGLWGLWVERNRWREPAIALPLVLTAVMLVVLTVGDSSPDALALPVLLPLSLLAVIGVLHLPRGPSNAAWWFSMLFFSFLVLMAWFEWFALEVGIPAARHRHWLRLEPGYVPHVELLVVAAGLVLSGAWVWLLLRLRSGAHRSLVAWAAGVAIVWALAFTMFNDYIDVDKSYREVMQSIGREVSRSRACVSSYNLGESQRAMLHYYAGIRTWREGVPGRSRHCEVLLVQGARTHIFVPGPEWVQFWEGTRRGERRELFRLYRRAS
jgi:4-amino-4-deoxy-L-arabinose transferase-like glycosyltransferase